MSWQITSLDYSIKVWFVKNSHLQRAFSLKTILPKRSLINSGVTEPLKTEMVDEFIQSGLDAAASAKNLAQH